MKSLPLLALLIALPLGAAEPLSLSDAIRRSWSAQAGLKAGEAMVESRRAEALAYEGLRLPTVGIQAYGMRTDEPMMAFGVKLNQARIGMMDFNPATLNKPEAIGAFGGGLSLQQPLYAGGRISAAREAGRLLAESERASQERRKQEVALAIVQAYFGAEVADQAHAWVGETIAWAEEMERFVRARVDQGLWLPSELARVKAFRATAEAQGAEIQKQQRTARSGLGLLTGGNPVEAPLSTPLESPGSAVGGTGNAERADLQAAALQAQAAAQGSRAARGGLLPEVGLELGAGTLRHSLSDGGHWTSASVGLRWKLFNEPERRKAQAAAAQERAAREMLSFKRQQAAHEVREARDSVTAATARIQAARQALAAAEESRRLREARHKEGLLPLLEVLDAQAALEGARTLLLQSLYDLRVNQARLDLALGTPIEGVQ
ncbi:MAG: TolC family protein [Acidobacteria bacterium]|nr:TolC family protein [Acidobacteriota bacterium]